MNASNLRILIRLVTYSKPLDLDLRVRGREGRGSPWGMSAARSGALEFNGEASPVVVELREDDDGVQTEMARMTVCRDWSVASYRCEGTWPKVSGELGVIKRDVSREY
jgi:hypothetical protein